MSDPRHKFSEVATSPTCKAKRHATASMYREYGCRCPEAVVDYWAKPGYGERIRTRRQNRARDQRRLAMRMSVDEVVVERLVAGQWMKSTREEKYRAYARLKQYSYSHKAIIERLHISSETIKVFRERYEESLQMAA